MKHLLYAFCVFFCGATAVYWSTANLRVHSAETEFLESDEIAKTLNWPKIKTHYLEDNEARVVSFNLDFCDIDPNSKDFGKCGHGRGMHETCVYVCVPGSCKWLDAPFREWP